MKWSKWPYWLRGGLFLGAVFLLLGLTLTIAGMSIEELGKLNPLLKAILVPPVLLSLIPTAIIEELSLPRSATLFLSLYSIVGFIVGVVFGWLYGKIKNRRTSTLYPLP